MDASCYSEIAALEEEHWWFVARRRIVQSVLDRLDLESDSAILEAGCGTGGNFPLLTKYGSLTAFEPEERARERAIARGTARVVQGTLPDGVPLEGESFDLVVLLDVLEHVPEDQAALQTLRRLLKPGGALLITVPAYEFLWSHHDVINHHQRRYRRSTLERRVRRAGFSVTHSTYFNTVLFPLVAAVRGYNRLTGQKGGSDLQMPSAGVNTLLRQVFSSERLVVPYARLPFGVSILMTAQKSEP